jgi:dihydropyrimidinase
MARTTVIRNGRVVTSSETFQADVLVEDGVIAAVGRSLRGDEVIDAAGMLVLPGGVDVHTHMEMPVGAISSTDDFCTGTVAAACGGTTTIIDFVEPLPGQGLCAALDERMDTARSKVAVDYGLHMTMISAEPSALDEMATVTARGVTSFKVYMAYAGLMLDDEALLKVLVRSREVGGRVSVHAENGHMIRYLTERFVREGKRAPIWHARSHPPEAEGEAVGRVIDLAGLAQAEVYLVHVSSAAGLGRVGAARDAGRKVWAETCPQYLVLDEERYGDPAFGGARFVMSPPLRTKADQDALWRGLADGLLQTVATDHCPFNFRGQKELGRNSFALIPNGAGGVETRLALLYHFGVNAGRISVNRFVDVACTSPARLFGLGGRKGSIAAGCDADLVLWDPDRTVEISAGRLHQNVDYTPFEGMAVKGWPALTMLRGQVIVRDGTYVGRRGDGRFLRRDCLC